jgi:hypothetical protein
MEQFKSHVVFRTKSSKSGMPEAVNITSLEDQAQFCKDEGLVPPTDELQTAILSAVNARTSEPPIVDTNMAYERWRAQYGFESKNKPIRWGNFDARSATITEQANMVKPTIRERVATWVATLIAGKPVRKV